MPVTAAVVAQKVNSQFEPSVATDRPVDKIQTRNLALTAARDARPRRKRKKGEPLIAYPKTRYLPLATATQFISGENILGTENWVASVGTAGAADVSTTQDVTFRPAGGTTQVTAAKGVTFRPAGGTTQVPATDRVADRIRAIRLTNAPKIARSASAFGRAKGIARAQKEAACVRTAGTTDVPASQNVALRSRVAGGDAVVSRAKKDGAFVGTPGTTRAGVASDVAHITTARRITQGICGTENWVASVGTAGTADVSAAQNVALRPRVAGGTAVVSRAQNGVAFVGTAGTTRAGVASDVARTTTADRIAHCVARIAKEVTKCTRTLGLTDANAPAAITTPKQIAKAAVT